MGGFEKEEDRSKPLIVDLDGTLIRSDSLVELGLKFIKEDLLAPLKMMVWLMRGKAWLKRRLTKRITIDVSTLPYRAVLVDFLSKEKRSGRRVVLATASDVELAQRVDRHLRLFDEVVGSDSYINLSGEHKAITLVNKYGRGNFDYIGNSWTDLAVWRMARYAHVVTDSRRLLSAVGRVSEIGMVWSSSTHKSKEFIKALRPYQWVKNILVFIPMLADHQLNIEVVGKTSMAFVVFCLTASTVYLINDLFDLESDRRHATKKNRPLASGSMPILMGIAAVPIMLGLAGVLALWLPREFGVVVALYFGLNLVYSLGAKQIVLLDVVVLAVLYTLRVFAGGAVVDITVSAWLMALIVFLALSGALMKRYIEIVRNNGLSAGGPVGRGYIATDVTVVGQLGIISGYLSVLVLALYVNSTEVHQLYKTPEYWWLVALLLLYAVSRGWLYAYRGKIHEDPIIFLLRDPINYWVLGLTVFLVLLAI